MLRHKRLRRNVMGTSERPRLAVYRSNQNLYTQVIDDSQGQTLAAANTLQADVKGDVEGKTPMDIAAAVGRIIAERSMAKGIKQVVFDRGGFKYHGRIKALADAAREAGLEF